MTLGGSFWRVEWVELGRSGKWGPVSQENERYDESAVKNDTVWFWHDGWVINRF